MIIEENRNCDFIDIRSGEYLHLRQDGEWIQMDKQQATQLIEVLTKWIETGEVE
jgi:hypothetical protein